MGKLQRQCQGHSQQVQELERLLESAGQEVAHVRQLQEAGAESDKRAQVSHISLLPLIIQTPSSEAQRSDQMEAWMPV